MTYKYSAGDEATEDKESYPECAGCGEGLYDEETIYGDDWMPYCGNCIADGFANTVEGFEVIHTGFMDGKHTFEVRGIEVKY